MSLPSDSISPLRDSTGSRVVVLAAFVLLLVVFARLYICHLFINENPNSEATDIPLTVAHLSLAHEKGVRADEYFQKDYPVWANLKAEDPRRLTGYCGMFQFQLMACMVMWNLCFMPFVNVLGVGAHAIAAFSTFYSVCAIAAIMVFAYVSFGRWVSILGGFFLVTSLSWLIHTKVGYPQWMPSALIMSLIMICAFLNSKKGGYRFLILMGVLQGLLYLMCWLSVFFGGMLILLAVVLEGPRTLSKVLVALCVLAASFGATVLAVSWVYSLYFGYDMVELHRTMFAMMFGRFSQGTMPFFKLSVAGKIFLGLKCMFVDMEWIEHVDKQLEGQPSISVFFTICFVIGLLSAIKERSVPERLLLIFLLSVFWPLDTVAMYSNRYAIMALPGMAVLAARGVVVLAGDIFRSKPKEVGLVFVLLLCCGMAYTTVSTYQKYYGEYVLNKKPNLEIDVVRGQLEVSSWIKNSCPQRETLVIMNDPTTFPCTCFLFNTFGWEYPFVYWSNHLGPGAAPKDVLAWEDEMLKRYRHLVYAFSTQLLASRNGPGAYFNDWRPFMAAHPELRPVFTYSYAQRPPLIVMFRVQRP